QQCLIYITLIKIINIISLNLMAHIGHGVMVKVQTDLMMHQHNQQVMQDNKNKHHKLKNKHNHNKLHQNNQHKNKHHKLSKHNNHNKNQLHHNNQQIAQVKHQVVHQ